MNLYGYSSQVWRLFQELPRAGTFGDEEAVSVQVTSNASRAVLELQVQVEDGQIRDARFRALGCPTTIAVGAWLASHLTEAGVDQLPSLDAKRLRDALEIPEDRAHCALLGEDAVRALQAKLATVVATNP